MSQEATNQEQISCCAFCMLRGLISRLRQVVGAFVTAPLTATEQPEAPFKHVSKRQCTHALPVWGKEVDIRPIWHYQPYRNGSGAQQEKR